MTLHGDKVYLQSILDSIAKIEQRGSSGANAEMIFEATVFHLITIGEAASKLSQEMKVRHPQVPWAQIVAHRNVLVHNYLGIDEEVVHTIVLHRLPELKQSILAILKDLS